jgi:glycosyltransferase involved in cell wall biosynthesis
MKILYVAAFAKPRDQLWFSLGRQRKIGLVLAMLADLGHTVLRLNIAPQKNVSPISETLALCSVQFPPLRFIQICITSIFLFLASARLKSSDIIWLYNSRFAESLVALVCLLLRTHCKLIIQLEDLPSARKQNHGISGYLDWLTTEFLCKRAHHIFAVSPNVAAALVRRNNLPSKSISLLPPVLDLCFEASFRNRPQPFSNRKLRILYAGSFQSEKGVLDLIHAFIDLDPQMFDLYLVGSCPQETISNYSAFANIVFTGIVDEQQLFNYYTSADIVVNPHRPILNSDYVFPFKLIETVASGALPLTTPVPGCEALNLPDVCFFTTVDDLSSKLKNSREIWNQYSGQLLESASTCLTTYSYGNIKSRIQSVINSLE